MPISIHLDSTTLEELDSCVKITGLSRSGLIKKAVHEWFERRNLSEWNRLLDTLAGSMKEFKGFETSRDDLEVSDENPLEI